jgi:hypothetical protein
MVQARAVRAGCLHLGSPPKAAAAEKAPTELLGRYSHMSRSVHKAAREGLFDLLFSLGLLGGRNLRPGGLPRQPLGLETLPVCMKRILTDLVLAHCLFGIDLAKCLARIVLGFGDWLGWFELGRCLCHFSPCVRVLAQIAASNSNWRRKEANGEGEQH